MAPPSPRHRQAPPLTDGGQPPASPRKASSKLPAPLSPPDEAALAPSASAAPAANLRQQLKNAQIAKLRVDFLPMLLLRSFKRRRWPKALSTMQVPTGGKLFLSTSSSSAFESGSDRPPTAGVTTSPSPPPLRSVNAICITPQIRALAVERIKTQCTHLRRWPDEALNAIVSAAKFCFRFEREVLVYDNEPVAAHGLMVIVEGSVVEVPPAASANAQREPQVVDAPYVLGEDICLTGGIAVGGWRAESKVVTFLLIAAHHVLSIGEKYLDGSSTSTAAAVAGGGDATFLTSMPTAGAAPTTTTTTTMWTKDIRQARERVMAEHFRQSLLLMRQSWICRNLSDDEVYRLIDHLVPQSFAPGQDIVTEGTMTPFMYFLRRGVASIVSGSIYVKDLFAGVAFGEMSVLFGEKRMATVRCRTVCDCWVLHRKDFDAVVRHSAARKTIVLEAAQNRARWLSQLPRTALKQSLSKVPLFSGLITPELLDDLANAAVPQVIPQGAVVASVSAACESLTVISHGTCREVLHDAKNEPAEYDSGDVLGQMCLVSHRWPTCVAALTMLDVFALPRKVLQSVLSRHHVYHECWQRTQILLQDSNRRGDREILYPVPARPTTTRHSLLDAASSPQEHSAGGPRERSASSPEPPRATSPPSAPSRHWNGVAPSGNKLLTSVYIEEQWPAAIPVPSFITADRNRGAERAALELKDDRRFSPVPINEDTEAVRRLAQVDARLVAQMSTGVEQKQRAARARLEAAMSKALSTDPSLLAALSHEPTRSHLTVLRIMNAFLRQQAIRSDGIAPPPPASTASAAAASAAPSPASSERNLLNAASKPATLERTMSKSGRRPSASPTEDELGRSMVSPVVVVPSVRDRNGILRHAYRPQRPHGYDAVLPLCVEEPPTPRGRAPAADTVASATTVASLSLSPSLRTASAKVERGGRVHVTADEAEDFLADLLMGHHGASGSAGAVADTPAGAPGDNSIDHDFLALAWEEVNAAIMLDLNEAALRTARRKRRQEAAAAAATLPSNSAPPRTPKDRAKDTASRDGNAAPPAMFPALSPAGPNTEMAMASTSDDPHLTEAPPDGREHSDARVSTASGGDATTQTTARKLPVANNTPPRAVAPRPPAPSGQHADRHRRAKQPPSQQGGASPRRHHANSSADHLTCTRSFSLMEEPRAGANPQSEGAAEREGTTVTPARAPQPPQPEVLSPAAQRLCTRLVLPGSVMHLDAAPLEAQEQAVNVKAMPLSAVVLPPRNGRPARLGAKARLGAELLAGPTAQGPPPPSAVAPSPPDASPAVRHAAMEWFQHEKFASSRAATRSQPRLTVAKGGGLCITPRRQRSTSPRKDDTSVESRAAAPNARSSPAPEPSGLAPTVSQDDVAVPDGGTEAAVPPPSLPLDTQTP